MATQAVSVGGYPPGMPESPGAKFARLANQWSEETEFVSSTTTLVLNGAYQQIIGMGQVVIPFILHRLELQGGHWFWALKHIAGEDPVQAQDFGNYERMREAWLTWGRERHYL